MASSVAGRSVSRLLLVLVLLALAPAAHASAGAARQNRPVAGLLGLQTDPQDADAASTACLKKDDTQCAVDVWEAKFQADPDNDHARQSLWASLVEHAFRSLDKGHPARAKAAIVRAKELVPSDPSYAYFDEAFRTYKSNILVDGMTFPEFLKQHTTSFESRYVDVAGVLGGQTKAIELTGKVPGY